MNRKIMAIAQKSSRHYCNWQNILLRLCKGVFDRIPLTLQKNQAKFYETLYTYHHSVAMCCGL